MKKLDLLKNDVNRRAVMLINVPFNLDFVTCPSDFIFALISSNCWFLSVSMK